MKMKPYITLQAVHRGNGKKNTLQISLPFAPVSQLTRINVLLSVLNSDRRG